MIKLVCPSIDDYEVRCFRGAAVVVNPLLATIPAGFIKLCVSVFAVTVMTSGLSMSL